MSRHREAEADTLKRTSGFVLQQDWMGDAQVDSPAGRGSVFDLVEDTDAAECLEKLGTVRISQK